MKHLLEKSLSSLFVVVFSVVFAGLALAHGDRHDGQRGERIAMTWLIDGTSKTFEVNAPVNPPLKAVKMHFMAKARLPVKHAEHYVVEKVVVTNIPGRDPSLPPDVIQLPGAGTPVTSYVLLDESKSLKELGMVSGDTLRIREVADHDLSMPHHGRKHHSDKERHHR